MSASPQGREMAGARMVERETDTTPDRVRSAERETCSSSVQCAVCSAAQCAVHPAIQQSRIAMRGAGGNGMGYATANV